MNIGKITKIEATCLIVYKSYITESKFREVCDNGLHALCVKNTYQILTL
ncbi:hypothetical protein [Clostridioides difficile]|nr:hypothetical protein [Clostridioides difficile]